MRVVPSIEQTELAKVLQVGKEQLRKLRKEGLPANKSGNKLCFSPQEVFNWLVESNRHKHAARIASAYKVSSVSDPDEISADDAAIADIDAFLKGMQRAEVYARAMMDACAESDNKAQLPYLVESYTKAGKDRGVTEEKVLAVKQKKGQLIERDDVNRKNAELGSLVKSKALSWIAKLPPMLHGKTMPEMSKELDREVRELLEDLSR